MKTLLFSIFLLTTTVHFGQGPGEMMNVGSPIDPGNEIFRIPLFNSLQQLAEYKEYNKNTSTILGSPYLTDTFLTASISGFKHKLSVRYNALSDEIEVDRGEKNPYALKKEAPFTLVTFDGINTKIKLCQFKNTKNESTNGYLVELNQKNELVLYKRLKTTFNPGRPARNTFDTGIPAKFVIEKPLYYVEVKDTKVIAFPTSKKEAIDFYPSKKEATTDFMNNNKINFKEEKDIILLFTFFSTLQ